MYFECSIKYWGDDLNSPMPRRKQFINKIVCSAYTYTDAEAIATEWAIENIEEEDFSIHPIKDLNVNSVHFSPNKEGIWFKTSGVFYTENQNGNLKENRINYLVQADNQKEAYDFTNRIMSEDFNEFKILKVEETKIEEYVI